MEKKKVNSLTQVNKNLMLKALEQSLGVVTTAAKATGVSRTKHYGWMNEDEAYKNAVLDVHERTVDFAESALHKLIKGGNVASTIFYLKTKGKKRGYVERVEHTGNDGAAIKILNLGAGSEADEEAK